MTESLIQLVRRSWAAHEAAAVACYKVFVDYCGEAPCRVPGMDTGLRLAVRIESGLTTEEAAAREYLYRWNLALKSPIFGVPHTLGF